MTMQNRNPRARLTRWMTGVLAAAVVIAAAEARAGEEKAVGEANVQFYAALNAMFTGDVSGMKQIWSHADDVTYMGPGGGFQVGWEQVWATWETQAALKLGGKIKPDEMRVTVGGDLAFVNCYELGNNLDAQGQPQHVSIRATNLFRKENGEWKMIGHHTDLLPYLEKQPLTTPAESD